MSVEVKVLSCDGYYAEVALSSFEGITFIVYIEKDTYYGGRTYRAYCSDPSTKARDDVLFPIAEALKKRLQFDYYGSVPCDEDFVLAAAKAVVGKEHTQFGRTYGAEALRNFASLSQIRQNVLYPKIKHLFAFYFLYERRDRDFLEAALHFQSCPLDEIAAYALSFKAKDVPFTERAKGLLEQYIIHQPSLPIGKPLFEFLRANPSIVDPEACDVLLQNHFGVGVDSATACLYYLEHNEMVLLQDRFSRDSTFESLSDSPLSLIRSLYFGLAHRGKEGQAKQMLEEIARKTRSGSTAWSAYDILGESSISKIIQEFDKKEQTRSPYSYYDRDEGPFFGGTFFHKDRSFFYVSLSSSIELINFGIKEEEVSRYGDLKMEIRNLIKKQNSASYGPSSNFPASAVEALIHLGDSWINKYLSDESHYTQEVRKSPIFCQLLYRSSLLVRKGGDFQEYPL